MNRRDEPRPDVTNTEQVLRRMEGSGEPIRVKESFQLETLPSLLNRHMGKRNMSTDALFERIGVNRSFGYRVMNGQRQPGRDVLLSIAFELELSYDETQGLLKVGRVAQLTPREKRDMLILFCIMHHKPLEEANSLLAERGLLPLTRSI